MYWADRATQRIQPVAESHASGINLWWASSVTGLAAAIIVIVLINWNRPTAEPLAVEQIANRTVPVAVDELQGFSPPRLIKTADFATPLEEELAGLAQAGFEAECVWNAGPENVVVARKPAEGV